MYFNANGSFSDTDTGSILGTYMAKNGVLTLSSSCENIVLAYKIKWGKLYLYEGKKEYIYARILKKGEPQSALMIRMICVEDGESFTIYNTDISGKIFITDEMDEPQYKYKIAVDLNNEQMQLFEDFTEDHLYHDIEVGTGDYGVQIIPMDSMITDDRVVIAYFDNESDARACYRTIE